MQVIGAMLLTLLVSEGKAPEGLTEDELRELVAASDACTDAKGADFCDPSFESVLNGCERVLTEAPELIRIRADIEDEDGVENWENRLHKARDICGAATTSCHDLREERTLVCDAFDTCEPTPECDNVHDILNACKDSLAKLKKREASEYDTGFIATRLQEHRHEAELAKKDLATKVDECDEEESARASARIREKDAEWERRMRLTGWSMLGGSGVLGIAGPSMMGGASRTYRLEPTERMEPWVKRTYWSGLGLLVAGVLLTVPSVVILVRNRKRR